MTSYPSQAGIPRHPKSQTRGQPTYDDGNDWSRAAQKRLADALGLGVNINHRPRGGTLAICYRSLEQLDEVVRRLEGKR